MDNDQSPTEAYPSECTISDDEYRTLKEALLEHEDWRSHVETWPPTDVAGNVYPLWFTVDELNSRGELVDENGNNYNPFTGNMAVLQHDRENSKYCNAPVAQWRDRYPSIRYCATVLTLDNDTEYDIYCYLHQGRKNVTNIETAEERLQNGLHTHTVDHLYSRLNPWKKLLAHGIYESLLGDASYEYGVEYDVETFDFSDVETAPPDVDDDGKLDVRVGRPTQYTDRSLSLWQAAMLRVQALYVQPKILYENREQGEDVMESKTVESAQLTAPPSEHDPTPQEFKTLETWSEHHLNMPLSRLFSDLQDVLEYGGVTIEPDNEDNDIEADEIVLEIDAESEEIETVEETGTDPNVHGFDNKSESQKIVESTSGDSD